MGKIAIEILGGGCSNCAKLEENVREACEQLGVSAEFKHVRDFGEIARRGVMALPALVVKGEVKVSGRVPSTEELKKLLKD